MGPKYRYKYRQNEQSSKLKAFLGKIQYFMAMFQDYSIKHCYKGSTKVGMPVHF